MKDIFKLSKKVMLGVAAGFLFNLSSAQTLADGIISLDSHKYAKAKEIYSSMISTSPTAENYFYLGNAYLVQFEPNFAKAKEYFDKGLTVDNKSFLNRIGQASVRLGKGDKAAIQTIDAIVKDSKERDPEVLFRAGQALTMFDDINAPDLAITYLNKAVEKAQKGGVPANYYYTLGDAYRLKKMPGDAMNAYDRASGVAKNKASVFTRMGTLWMAAKQWKLAKDNIDKAIAVDPTYAPAYRALANYNITYHNHETATQNLLDYAKYADEDPSTQLEIAKLYFLNDNIEGSRSVLDKIFDKVEDPIKHKLRAFILYGDRNYTGAKQSLDSFFTKAEPSRIIPADKGLLGLIYAGLAKEEKDEAVKSNYKTQSEQNILIAKNAKDETFDWDRELIKIKSGGGIKLTDALAGPSNTQIEELRKQVKANPEDTNALFQLGNAYAEAKNWLGAAYTWQQLNDLLPTWEPAFYNKAYTLQEAGKTEMSVYAFEEYIAVIKSKKPEEQAALKENLVSAYYSIAYILKDTDKAKAHQMLDNALALNPADKNSQNLKKFIK